MANMSGSGPVGRKRPGPPPVPAHIKYKTRTSHFADREPTVHKQRPSNSLSALVTGTPFGSTGPGGDPAVPDEPKIIDFLNLEDNTSQTTSSVDVNRPLFQAYPSVLTFGEYAAFGVYEQTLYFRNNDAVARRIRVLPPDSPYFEVIGPRSPVKMAELKQVRGSGLGLGHSGR